MLKWVCSCLSLLMMTNAGAVDLDTYKGVLRITISGQQDNGELSVQYRTRTREVLRIGLNDLVMTDQFSNRRMKLAGRVTSLSSRVEDGYWVAELSYDDLDLRGSEYRTEGTLVFYLSGSQQSRKFSLYVKPESMQ